MLLIGEGNKVLSIEMIPWISLKKNIMSLTIRASDLTGLGGVAKALLECGGKPKR